MLPFANLSGDPSQDYFADGITEDLITDLAKLSGLDVIARNSVFAYKGKPLVLADVGRDLGVRFVVDGSVRRTGDQIRLNAQLIDIATGDNLWANRFDRGIADVFAVQDEMSREIAKALGVQAFGSRERADGTPADCQSRGLRYYLRAEQAARTGRRDGLREALALYDKAEKLDPAFAEAFAADARTSVYVWRTGFDDIIQSALARKRAYEKASRALELDPDVFIALRRSRHHAGHGSPLRRSDQPRLSGPSHSAPEMPRRKLRVGYVQLFAGNHAEAAAAVETALKLDPNLSPIDREVAGLVFLLARRHRESHRDSRTHPRRCAGGRRISDYARRGLCPRRPLARTRKRQSPTASGWWQDRILRSRGHWHAFGINYAHFRNAEDLALIIDALRQAGLPEWPFGFTADENDRLKGEEIASLVLGHTLKGQLEPDGQPAIMQIGHGWHGGFPHDDANADRESLCRSRPLMRAEREYVWAPRSAVPSTDAADAAGKGYSYVNATMVFHFVTVN